MKTSPPNHLAGFIAAAIFVVVSGPILWWALSKSGYWGLESYLTFYGTYGPTVAAVFWLFSKRQPSPPETTRSAGTGESNGPKQAKSIGKSTAKRFENRIRLGCAAFLIATTGMTAIGFICAYALDAHPMDRASILVSYAFIGLLAGGTVAVVILLASIFE